jgi:hypothetical protein
MAYINLNHQFSTISHDFPTFYAHLLPFFPFVFRCEFVRLRPNTDTAACLAPASATWPMID